MLLISMVDSRSVSESVPSFIFTLSKIANTLDFQIDDLISLNNGFVNISTSP